MIRISFFIFYFLPYILFAQTAFISGNDTICQNDQYPAEISVSFSGVSPYTFSFAIDGVVQPTVITSINPYIINTNAMPLIASVMVNTNIYIIALF